MNVMVNDRPPSLEGRLIETQITIAVPEFLDDGAPTVINDLYRKATRNQWDVLDDVDWSPDVDINNPLQMPDGTNPLASTPLWKKLSDAQKIEVRQSLQGWHLSQILHGERASLLCAGKLMLSSVEPDIKYCASLQATDEARHIEAFTLLLNRFHTQFPVSPSLKSLLDSVLEDPDPGITALGMQILVEGLALAFFKSLQVYSNDTVTKSLLALVVRDEARHFAFGQKLLKEQHAHLSQAELNRREEFVVESCRLLDNYLFADEIWGPLGLPEKDCADYARSSPVNAAMHRMLFRHLVPAIRGLGLLGPEATRYFELGGMLDYAAYPA
jgi:hypothetical protein